MNTATVDDLARFLADCDRITLQALCLALLCEGVTSEEEICLRLSKALIKTKQLIGKLKQ